MVIQTKTHTATVTKQDDTFCVKIFVNGVTPRLIDERNWATQEAAAKDASAMMKLGGYK